MAPKAPAGGMAGAVPDAVPKAKAQPSGAVAFVRPGSAISPSNPWAPAAKKEVAGRDDTNGLKGFLDGAPMPGEDWADGMDEDAAPTSASRARPAKQNSGAGLLAGIFGDSPAFIPKRKQEDEMFEPTEPASKAPRSVSSLLAGLPKPKT